MIHAWTRISATSLFVLALSTPCHAIEAEQLPVGESVTVSVPESKIKEDAFTSDRFEPTRVDISVSSWVPDNLLMKDRLNTASAFHSGSFPAFSISYLLSSWHGIPGVSTAIKLGGGFDNLYREGSFDYNFAHQKGGQTVDLIALRAGFDLSPDLLRWKGLATYVGFSALPSMLVLQPSIFSDGESMIGVPFEATAGLIFDLQRFWPSLTTQLGTGYVQTFGKIKDADLSGRGIFADLRISI